MGLGKETVDLYYVTCDKCQEMYEDVDGVALFGSTLETTENALSEDWVEDGDGHIYCPTCAEVDPEDETKIKFK